MTARQFVAAWKRERRNLLKEFGSPTGTTQVATKIRELNLSEAQRKQVVAILDAALTDTFYTLLLGLDGSASIGGIQQTYKIYGEDGKLISDCGDIEAEAAEAFQ
jgi:formamidopyrimidine-DNA glycosylase